MLSLYLPIFLNTDLLLSLYTHLYTNSEHRSPLPLGLISTPSWSDLLFLCSTLKPQALSLPQASTHNNRCTCRESFQSSTDLSCQHRSSPPASKPILVDPQASIVPVKHQSFQSSIDQASICLFVGFSVWVCLCVGVFMYLCVDLSVWMFCVWVCLCVSEKKEDEERSH